MRIFFTLNQGRAYGAPAIRPAGRIGRSKRVVIGGKASLANRAQPSAKSGKAGPNRGLWAAACRAPSGGSPTGAAPHAGQLARNPQAGGGGRNASR